MISKLLQGLFFLITKLFDLLFSPLISAITLLFPDLSEYLSHIVSFINTSCTYVSSVLRLLLIDSTMMSAIFDYFLITYSIYITVRSIKFIVNVYQKLKL